MQTDAVQVFLSTPAGDELNLDVPHGTSVKDAKLRAAETLGQLPERQRWLAIDSPGSVLNDNDVITSCLAPLHVQCLLLPHIFSVNVKVVKFTPGAEAQCVQEALVEVSPDWLVEGAKTEVAAQCGLRVANSKLRLMYNGRIMQDRSILEHYHVDPDTTIHLVVPRSCVGEHFKVCEHRSATAVSAEAANRDMENLAVAATAKVAASISDHKHELCASEGQNRTVAQLYTGFIKSQNSTIPQCDAGADEDKDSILPKQDATAKKSDATDGHGLYRTLGRSHLRRCRSLSEIRHGAEAKKVAETLAEPDQSTSRVKVAWEECTLRQADIASPQLARSCRPASPRCRAQAAEVRVARPSGVECSAKARPPLPNAARPPRPPSRSSVLRVA